MANQPRIVRFSFLSRAPIVFKYWIAFCTYEKEGETTVRHKLNTSNKKQINKWIYFKYNKNTVLKTNK